VWLYFCSVWTNVGHHETQYARTLGSLLNADKFYCFSAIRFPMLSVRCPTRPNSDALTLCLNLDVNHLTYDQFFFKYRTTPEYGQKHSR
jgi:hypothetical protein